MTTQGRRVMVTGGTGFLGRHVVAEFERSRSDEVLVPSHAEYDLRNPSDIDRVLGRFRPDVVVHLAATVGGIGANTAQPGKFFYDNAVMGLHLMEAARLANVEKFVTIGTVCEYPRITQIPFREEDLWNGYPEPATAPYAMAKRMMLVQGQVYREEYGFNAIHLLPVNLYGPGDNYDEASSHVVPALIRKFVDATRTGVREVHVWGTGSASREFLYVDDAAQGIVMATRSYDGAEPVNLGTGRETTIRELAEMVASATGFTGSIRWDRQAPEGQPRRCLDVSRAARFGFMASTSLEEGLQHAVNDYLARVPGKAATAVG